MKDLAHKIHAEVEDSPKTGAFFRRIWTMLQNEVEDNLPLPFEDLQFLCVIVDYILSEFPDERGPQSILKDWDPELTFTWISGEGLLVKVTSSSETRTYNRYSRKLGEEE